MTWHATSSRPYPSANGRRSSGFQNLYQHHYNGEQQEEVPMELETPARFALASRRRDGIRMREGTGRTITARSFTLKLNIVPPSMQRGSHRQSQQLQPWREQEAAAAAELENVLQDGDGGSGGAERLNSAGGSVDGPGGDDPGGSGSSVGPGAARAAMPMPVAAMPRAPRQHTPQLGAREPRANFTADLGRDWCIALATS
jgi:hypothetical protein